MTSSLFLVVLFLQREDMWILRSWPLPRLSLQKWKLQGLSEGLAPLSQAPCIWLRSLTGPGAPVETTGDLTQSQFLTGTLYPQSLISLRGYPAPKCSPSWTCWRGTIKFLWEIRMLSKLLLLLLLACLSSWAFLLALGMQFKHSGERWIISLVTCPFFPST